MFKKEQKNLSGNKDENVNGSEGEYQRLVKQGQLEDCFPPDIKLKKTFSQQQNYNQI